MHIYLDETGNLTKSKEKYFIVGSFTVGDPQRIANAFRRWQRSKFPAKIRSQPEVKFNDHNISDDLRLKTITFLAKQDVRIFYTFLKVTNIPEKYRGKGDAIKTGLLYTEIVGETIDLYNPFTDRELRVFRDQRLLKGVTTTAFNEHLGIRLQPQLPASAILRIEAMDSTSSPQIQVADWICGALGRFYEKKVLGERLYMMLRNNIIQEKELFSDYWTKRWNK